MAETIVRELKINKRYAGKPCGWCGHELLIGDDGAICEACESGHHARCWQDHSGRGLSTCVSAPLRDLGLLENTRRLRSDEKVCRHCEQLVYVDADICPHCGQIVTADGIYRGKQTTAREAKLAIMFSIGGLFFVLGLVLGPMAFLKGLDAEKAIAANPQLRGRPMAIAGRIIGIIDVLVWLTYLLASGSRWNLYNSAYIAEIASGIGYLAILIRLRRCCPLSDVEVALSKITTSVAIEIEKRSV